MYVFYRFETDVSGIILAKFLEFPHGLTPPPKGGPLLVRWGNSTCDEIEDLFQITINNAESIRSASRKINTMPLLLKEGVRIPIFSLKYNELWDQELRQIVGQTRYHTEGRGFKYYDNIDPEDLKDPRDYYLSYIDGEEFRVLKCFNKLMLYRRTRMRPDANMLCRSTGNGWRLYRVRYQDKFEDLKTQAFKACETLGLEIAGVDLRFNDGKAYVLEVNSAPRLNQARAMFIMRQILRNT